MLYMHVPDHVHCIHIAGFLKRWELGVLRRLFMAACLFLLALHPAAALEQVSMQLKWKHQFQFAGYYVALEQGFYRDAGTRRQYPGGRPRH